MKQIVQTALIVSMIFLSAAVFGQTQEPVSKKTADDKKNCKNILRSDD